MISVGNQIGRYKVLNSIGVGGMGEVFLAVDTELERFVALKVLPADVSHDKERIRRFVQEAKAASALNHPNILTIHEIGSVNGTRFIASEFVKGKTLRDKLKSESLNLSETIEIVIQITSALHTAADTANLQHCPNLLIFISSGIANNLFKLSLSGI